MATIVTRAGKGSPLTNTEMDSNLTTLSTSIFNGTSNVAVNSSNGAATITTAGTTAITVDTSQNVGVGVAPGAWQSGLKTLQIGSYSSLGFDGANATFLGNNWIYSSAAYKYLNSSFATYYIQTGTGQHQWFNAPSGTAGNAVTFTQAMTLDASGKLFVGTTGLPSNGNASNFYGSGVVTRIYGTTDGTGPLLIDKSSATNTTSQYFVQFTVNNQATGSGSITANGASQAAFGSFSDRRLKENIVDLPSQLSNILALRTVEFDYIESEGGGHQIGFIAQEVKEIYPDLVGEREDGMHTLTDLNKNDARLIKAIQEMHTLIQEQQALITQLQADVAALTAK